MVDQPGSSQTTDCCAWTQDADGDWGTACGHRFVVIDGTPHDNDMRFCCYCGKTLLDEAMEAR